MHAALREAFATLILPQIRRLATSDDAMVRGQAQYLLVDVDAGEL